MQFIFMALFAAGIVAADQFTKFLTVANIALYQDIEFIPGFLGLTYVQNTGAAFSAFRGMQWLFALVFVLFAAAIVWEFSKKRWGFTNFERWCITLIFAGGLGNMIDRIFLGYVVDLFDFRLIHCFDHSNAHFCHGIFHQFRIPKRRRQRMILPHGKRFAAA